MDQPAPPEPTKGTRTPREPTRTTLNSLGRCLKVVDTFRRDFPRRLEKTISDGIKDLIEVVFSKYRLSATSLRELAEIGINVIVKDIWPPEGTSGVVIAGFGEEEKYPAVKTFTTDLVALDRLIYRDEPSMSTNLCDFEGPNPVAILPFAQRDVMDAFLRGIDPQIELFVRRFFSVVLRQWPDKVAENLPALSTPRKRALSKKLAEVSDTALEEFEERLAKRIRQRHVSPLLQAVAHLPKEELAAMAEAAINLTSVKRKMSLEIETVGGPADVAVITKGDGFVWTKRKHYFRPELNHHFFANYFRAGD